MVKKHTDNSNDTSLHAMLRKTSIAVQRTGVKDEQGREIVLACGYANNGQFGYFVIREHKVGDVFMYTDQRSFVKKLNERSFQEALNNLKEIVQSSTAPNA